MFKFLTEEQKALIAEIDLYIDNINLPHIPESKILTLTKDKFKQYQAIQNKNEKIELLAGIQNGKYRGYEIRPA